MPLITNLRCVANIIRDDARVGGVPDERDQNAAPVHDLDVVQAADREGRRLLGDFDNDVDGHRVGPRLRPARFVQSRVLRERGNMEHSIAADLATNGAFIPQHIGKS